MNLLEIKPLCKAIWTKHLKGEEKAPEDRIIHIRVVAGIGRLQLKRVGIKKGIGYFKCGSHVDYDWVSNLRLLVREGDNWTEKFAIKGQIQPEIDETVWFELNNIESDGVILEARRSGVDSWWTGWNLAMSGLVLDGELVEEKPEDNDFNLFDCNIESSLFDKEINCNIKSNEAFFSTNHYKVGFNLKRAGLTFLSIDEDVKGCNNNLLKKSTLAAAFSSNCEYLNQGLKILHAKHGNLAGVYSSRAKGKTTVCGNKVEYKIECGEIGQKYYIGYEMHEKYIDVNLQRQGEYPIRLVNSSIWSIAFDTGVSAVALYGDTIKTGETGLMKLPILIHAPVMGSFILKAIKGDILIRSDSLRQMYTNICEFKLGEIPQMEGDYYLPPGSFIAAFRIEMKTPVFAELQRETPDVIKKMVRKISPAAIPYRADTYTLSNNSNSIHAPICMDVWSGVITRFKEEVEGIKPYRYLRHSLERWLNDAPGYASGRRDPSGNAYYEDVYLMTGVNSLLGLAEYLKMNDGSEWFLKYKDKIVEQIYRMKKRDIDGDGLIESKERLGISGSHQWSTNWYDVISFGWKDAFTNANLYLAVELLEKKFRDFGIEDISKMLEDWKNKIKKCYTYTFYNSETGWLAGWRCKENKLHDYAFLAVNGAAVNAGLIEEKLAKNIMEKLWMELKNSSLKDYTMGLPGNLFCIQDYDMAPPQHGRPIGFYQNGGLTHSQSRHFVAGLYKVGMIQEGDELLLSLSEGMLNSSVYGGVGSGLDWKMWDGTPSGYEGILCDQFGILIPAIDRWGKMKKRD